jgi:hypothetical protein
MSGQGQASVFVVGRNPQEDSKLPYLLRLPLKGGLVLKARELWPATARVYCHRFEEPWPEDAEIVEQTPVLLCRRRGAAIDLVLDRPRRARSQFVFTQVKGRIPAAGSPVGAASPSRSRSPSTPVSAIPTASLSRR